MSCDARGQDRGTAPSRAQGAIHLPHSARAKKRKNRVRADLASHQRRAGLLSQHTRSDFSYRRREKPLGCLRVRQQRLHLLSQRVVACTGIGHERGPIGARAV